MSKKGILTKVKKWYKTQCKLKEVKKDESELRDALVNHFSTVLITGTNTFELVSGHELRIKCSQNVSVDADKLSDLRKELPRAVFKVLFKETYKINKAEYAKLNERLRKKVNVCLITTPAKPTIEYMVIDEE